MTGMLFRRIETFIENAVITLFPIHFPDSHNHPTEAQLNQIISWFYEYFSAVAQCCCLPDQGMTEDQARLICDLETVFRLDQSVDPEQILRSARARSSKQWEHLIEIALHKPRALWALELANPADAETFRSLVLDLATRLKASKLGPTQETEAFISTLSAAIASTNDRPETRSQSISSRISMAKEELSKMIGLEPVKVEIAGMIDLLSFSKRRVANGLPPVETSLHQVFYGNPGTGKTTVARLLSQIYKEIGLLSSGHLIEVSRAGLVAEYMGQTSVKVENVVKDALGGILFIDEAYALKQRADDSFGQEAIDTLNKLMEDFRDNLAVIVAGYTNEMKAFLQTNVGLGSKFNRHLNFPDYNSDELLAIFEMMLKSKQFALTEDARRGAMSLFRDAVEHKTPDFGNGRFARNVFETTLTRLAKRVKHATDPMSMTIVQAADLPAISRVST